MKAFLKDMFRVNLNANLRMSDFVRDVSPNDEIRKHLSHLANCQYKWLDRLQVFPQNSGLDWWDPVYDLEEIKLKFTESTQRWIDYLDSKAEHELSVEINYRGQDESIWTAELKDIVLQLIFHSFHHRAQIQMIIRANGQAPQFIDYIGTRAKKQGQTN
jgi:uncharacterized damage-inducible protein DinB